MANKFDISIEKFVCQLVYEKMKIDIADEKKVACDSTNLQYGTIKFFATEIRKVKFIIIFGLLISTSCAAFPTGQFLGFSNNNAVFDNKTASWKNARVDINKLGKSDIDFLSIRKTSDGYYMVNLEVHGFAAPRYYSCQFAGIFEQKINANQKMPSLVLEERYKPLGCNLSISADKENFLLHGDCSEFCEGGYSMNGFSIPRQTPNILKALKIGD